MVLSSIDLIMVFNIFGFLYGGSSSVNVDVFSFSMVFDSILEIINVIKIEKIITSSNVSADMVVFFSLLLVSDTINIDIIAISIGNLPLHGVNTFVSIAISFSFLDSIILHPITPQALHPYPIHMVNDCLPCAPHFLNILSMLNAILGKKPRSSSNVNRGKNIAIGGSITDITHATTLYIPFNKKSISV